MENRLIKFTGILLVGLGSVLICGGLYRLVRAPFYEGTAQMMVDFDWGGDLEDYLKFHPREREKMVYSFYRPSAKPVLWRIQSDVVLSNVVQQLKLSEIWGKETWRGTALTTNQAIKRLRGNLSVSQIRNTKFLSISYESQNREEAARIPNAVSEAMIEFENHQYKSAQEKGLLALKNHYVVEETKIAMIRSNFFSLQEKLKTPDDAATNELPEQIDYWKIKKEFSQRMEVHDLLNKKINAVQEELNNTNYLQYFRVYQPAVPPILPMNNRVAVISLMVGGLICLIAGIALIRLPLRTSP